MRRPPLCLLLLTGLICLSISVLPLHAENWPQWRGPEGNGTSQETDLPLAWNADSGIAWQCPLPEWGDSTPAIWGDAIFITTQVDNNKLLLLKISKNSRQVEWTREIGAENCPQMREGAKPNDQRRHQWFHDSHNFASPSPVTDGQLVIVHFGNGDLAACDFDGNQLWHRNLQKDYGDYTIWWGHANSPVLFENLVISICIQDSCADLPGDPSPSYVVAHDKRTGQERWKTMRMTAATLENCDSYTTPLLWKNGPRTELAIMGGQVLDAYNPLTGCRLWWLTDLTGNRTITGPVAAHGMIYVTQGMKQPLLAVRPGGDGQRPHEDIVWQLTQGTPDSPTPVVSGDSLFLVTNDGIARCLDALTGRMQWKERLKGEYRASPLAADGRIYFQNTQGLATVVAAAPRFNRLAENQIEDDIFASPIVSDGHIYLRGRKALYCLGK